MKHVIFPEDMEALYSVTEAMSWIYKPNIRPTEAATEINLI